MGVSVGLLARALLPLEGMIPLIAAGAASLTDVLVHRFSGSSSTGSGNTHVDSKSFQKSLDRAAGNRAILSPAEQQAAALTHRLLHSPEVESAISAQPAGSVTAVDVKADGTLHLRTSAGSVAVQLLPENRALAQQVYASSVLAGTPSSQVAATDPQSVVRLSLGNALR